MTNLDQCVQRAKSSPLLRSSSILRRRLSHLKPKPSMHFVRQRPQSMVPTIPSPLTHPVHLLLNPLSLRLLTNDHAPKMLKKAMNRVTRNAKMRGQTPNVSLSIHVRECVQSSPETVSQTSPPASASYCRRPRRCGRGWNSHRYCHTAHH